MEPEAKATCLCWRAHLYKAKKGVGWFILLFYYSRAHCILRKGFFQMTALFLWCSPETDLTSETDTESQLMCRGSNLVGPQLVLSNQGEKNPLYMNEGHLYSEHQYRYIAHSSPWTTWSETTDTCWQPTVLSSFPGIHMMKGRTKLRQILLLFHVGVGATHGPQKLRHLTMHSSLTTESLHLMHSLNYSTVVSIPFCLSLFFLFFLWLLGISFKMFFLVPSICLQISRCHCFLPLC